jgi:hypothetical protein
MKGLSAPPHMQWGPGRPWVPCRADKVPWDLQPYRWCSARRSSQGCTRTCHRGRSHAQCSAGGRPVDRMLPPSSHPHSGRCLPRRRHGLRSQQHRSLCRQKEEGGQGRKGREQNKYWVSSCWERGSHLAFYLGSVSDCRGLREIIWEDKDPGDKNSSLGRSLLCACFPTQTGAPQGSALFVFSCCQSVSAFVLVTSKRDWPSE